VIGRELGVVGVVVSASLGVAVACAFGATLRVPSEYAMLHSALDFAAAGDTVLVAPGTYGDDFQVRSAFGLVAALGFPGSGVLLMSEAGPQSTILDLSAGTGLVPTVTGLWIGGAGGVTTEVRGFKFQGAPVSGAWGLMVYGSQDVVISDCVFELDDPSSGTSAYRGGLAATLSSTRIDDCVFIGCRAPYAAGVGQGYGSMEVNRTVFRDCKNEAFRGTLGAPITVRDCVFDSNATANIGPSGLGDVGPGTVENCVFVNNQGIGAGAAILGNGLTVRGCLFDSNHVTGTGAALWLSGFGNLVENNTIVNSLQTVSTNAGSAIVFSNAQSAVLRNNIIAFSSGSPAIDIRQQSPFFSSSCNVFWQNAQGEGVTYHPGPTDRVVDPLFCDPAVPDWTLHEASPCLPTDPSGCGQIGDLGQGCGTVSVRSTSWGKVKSAYRDNAEVEP
jgi:hypothetical protein